MKYTMIHVFFLIIHLKWVQLISKTFSYDFIIPEIQSSFNAHYKLDFESTTELCLGTPSQCMTVSFNPSIYTTFIMTNQSEVISKDTEENIYGKTFEEMLILSKERLKNQTSSISNEEEKMTIINQFNPLLSETFSGIKTLVILDRRPNDLIKQFEEIVTFGNINGLVQLFLVKSDESKKIKHEIGLLKTPPFESYSSFFQQLYKQNIIDSSIITINFIGNQKGKIYFGMNETLQSIIETNPMIEIEIKGFLYYEKNNAYCNNITIGKTIISGPRYVGIDESIGFIQIPFSYFNDTINTLFPQNIISRFHKIIMKGDNNMFDDIIPFTEFQFFLIEKKYIINNYFNEVRFTFNNGTLRLRNEDLFKEFNETYMILKIVFSSYTFNDTLWIIGHPILQYYIIQHDLENGTIRLYLKDNYNFDRIIFCFIILCGCGIFGALILIIKVLLSLIRKQTKSKMIEKVNIIQSITIPETIHNNTVTTIDISSTTLSSEID